MQRLLTLTTRTRLVLLLAAALIVGGMLGQVAPPDLSAQGYSFGGTTSRTATSTFTAASISSPYRGLQAVVTLTPATTFSAGTTSLAATSGEIDLSAGKTITDGFFYGTRGKFVGTTGTFNQTSAGRITGVIGQVDLGTMVITSGQVSGVWADMQGSGPTLTSDEIYPLRVSNSLGALAKVDALAFFVGHADAALSFSDLGNGSSGDFVIDASGTGAGQCAQTGGVVFTKTLKIVADGTTYYIGLCTAP